MSNTTNVQILFNRHIRPYHNVLNNVVLIILSFYSVGMFLIFVSFLLTSCLATMTCYFGSASHKSARDLEMTNTIPLLVQIKTRYICAEISIDVYFPHIWEGVKNQICSCLILLFYTWITFAVVCSALQIDSRRHNVERRSVTGDKLTQDKGEMFSIF